MNKNYFLYAALAFAGLAILNSCLDELDPCHNEHTDICVEQPDYKGK